MKELKESIKSGNFEKLYVFYGDENYLKNYYAKKITDAVLSENERIMNLDVLDEKSYSAGALSEKCETAPFMADKRVIVIKGSAVFVSGKKEESEKTGKLFGGLPETAIVIFIEEKADKRLSLFKSAEKYGKCIEFNTPSEGDLIKWVTSLAKERGIKITPAVCAFFLQTVSDGMDVISAELDKLCAYADSDFKREIFKEDITALTTKSLGAKIFELTGAVSDKNPAKALDIYNNLLVLKESPLGILALISRQFKLALAAGELKSLNRPPKEIADMLGVRSFLISALIRQSVNFGHDILLRAFKECLETDINIKTGKIEAALGVEALIIKYSDARLS